MNATLRKLQKLLNSSESEPQVLTIDSIHVRQMKVVEEGTFAQMKRCLLNLPSVMISLTGTYVTSGWERSFTAMAAVDVVIGLTGTVAWDTEMTVIKNRHGPQGVRGQMANMVMLDDGNFRLEP